MGKEPQPTPAIILEKEEEPQETQEVIFKPNPGPQTEFLSAPEQEVLYGGAAGGGKSFALVVDPIRYFDNKNCQALLIRRTMPELRELINISKQLYPKVYPEAKWTERDSTWRFPSGAWLWMSYLEKDDDVMKYQGQAYNWIGFDELTQWPTPHGWNYLRSRLRTSSSSNLPLCMRASSNPGGPGHCLTHGEVLTPDRGWVDISEMEAGDAIYSVDKDGKLFETLVDHTYKEWVDEDIVKVSARGLNMSITQDHKVAKVGGTRENYNSAYSLVPFSDLPGQATILRSVLYEGKPVSSIKITHTGGRKRKLDQPHEISTQDYASLVGWYVAEGCRNHRCKAISIAQVKEEGREEIKNLLDRIGYKYNLSKSSFSIHCKSLYEDFAQYGDLCRNKKLPTWFKNLPKDSLEKFFESAMMGDGSGSYYYTTSKQLADDFQEVALKLGRIVYCSTRQREDRDGLVYQVSTKTTKSGGTEILTGQHSYSVSTSTKRQTNVQKVSYSGYVYCVGVPGTHTFIARQDGSVWVSGNTWVKKTFIDPATPNKPFWARDLDGNLLTWPSNSKYAIENDLVGKPMFKRRFIPANLFDNPYLSSDGAYEANLLSMPEHLRKQLLEGNWDVAEGAAFPEWNRNIHVVEPFEIPRNWVRFRACDYGYGSFSAVLWFAVDPSTNQLIVYRELKTNKVLAVDLADMILELEEGERIRYGVLDSSLWHNRGDTGPSLAEQMIRRGCRWRPSDRSKGSRVASKNEVHRRLQVDEYTEKPRIVFFNTCLNLISELPSLPLDKKNPEDVDTNVDDHMYDALRYGVMSRPTPNFFNDDTIFQYNWEPADSIMGY